MYSYGPPYMAEQKQDGQLEHTYSSSVKIWNVALKTCQKRWTIERSGKRGSGISVLVAPHDDDDDDDDTILKNIEYRILTEEIIFPIKSTSFRGFCQHISNIPEGVKISYFSHGVIIFEVNIFSVILKNDMKKT